MRSRKLYQSLILMIVCFAGPSFCHGQRLEVLLPEDPAAVIAVVGRSHVVLGDILPKADARIAAVLEQTGTKLPEKELKVARLGLVRGLEPEPVESHI